MKKYQNISKPISAEPFFGTIPKKNLPLDKTFVSLEDSIIWKFNHIFWKYFSLWEQTYHESYEASLPSGISESHKDEFVQKSVEKFITLLLRLEGQKKLPEKIIVLEQGPGTGLYAKKFLNYLQIYSQKNNKNFYKRIQYFLEDTSELILEAARKTLIEHQRHITTLTHDANKKKRENFYGKVLFARHSNMWDQFPVRLLLVDKQSISEVLVQAVTSSEFQHLQNREKIERFILAHPMLWKALIRSILCKTKIKKLTKKEVHDFPYSEPLEHLASITVDRQEIVVSTQVLENIERLLSVIDWERDGYIEVVDIIVPTLDGFRKDRRPKKYDGSVATVVNGLLIKAFLREKQKYAQFEQIRGINYTVTMRNHNIQTLLNAKNFITIGEIAAKRDEPIAKLADNAQALFTLGIDVVGFSDQAFVKPDYLSQNKIIQTGIFKQLPGQAIMPILKTRNKSWEEIQSLTEKLKRQGVTNLFVVTGDPGLEKEVLHTSIEITKKLKNSFFLGGVINADITTIPKALEKIEAGTKFFIMQATYDKKRFSAWVEEIKKHNIQQKVPIIAAIVPIVSRRTLSVLQFINDMSVANEVIQKFEPMNDVQLREEGIKLAKEMVAEYKETGIFSGIYIYSKSHEVICEVMGFPYNKNKNEMKDSL